ncbi:unnamed protein product, partial [Closterium sp. NIES-54]
MVIAYMAARIASKSRSKIATPALDSSPQRGISTASGNCWRHASVRRRKQRWALWVPPHCSPARSPVRRTAAPLRSSTSTTSATPASASTAATSATSATTATAAATPACTAATSTPTPATTSTATPTPSAASTTTSTAPTGPTRSLAPLALARAASPARGRRHSDRLKTNE